MRQLKCYDQFEEGCSLVRVGRNRSGQFGIEALASEWAVQL